MIPFPVSTWTAPTSLVYGTVGLTILVVCYLFGGRYIVGATARNDAGIALVITVGTGILGFIVLGGFPLEVWLSYAYGIILGLAIYHYIVKYRRATASEDTIETPDRV